MKWMQFFTPAESLDFKETETYIAQHPADKITILDVRQPSEYQVSHIPGATLIPLRPASRDPCRNNSGKKKVLSR